MPTAIVKKYAKKKGISLKKSEKRWNKAKKFAKKEGQKENWPYVMSIYKKMMGMNENHVFDFREFINEMILVRKKVEVPEPDIEEVIKSVKTWFEKNPTKDICRPSIFGHYICDIHKETMEKDIREAAKKAHPYTKVKKD